MSDELKQPEDEKLNVPEDPENSEQTEQKAVDDNAPKAQDDDIRHLPGMFRTWFLDYASYVNLERAIPHINDGLKPVQRRVLYSMRRMEDGRYNKVANIVGHTMQFHPHGDASIGDALTNLGQKELLIDCQGNWGNILTGDGAAAPRYIEARLSKFALDAVFNPKTTEWKPSYDGRNKEPISLPVKFPLLLAQGSEGIGLGLNSRILPHNFNELIEASIDYLHDKSFELYPDFLTGGMIDVSRYNDGERGGKVRIRARIEKVDNRHLKIYEVPYGVTTGKLIDSILRANDKGKINIKKVEDNTSAGVEILVYLEAKTSSDKTIDALYAFTDCEVSYSPNCCVIDDNKPYFITVSEVLKRSTDNTKALLNKELDIQLDELLNALNFASLERIFIHERIYKDKEFENAENVDAALVHIDKRIEPFKKDFVREVSRDDLLKLLEIKMARILKFNEQKADENIAALKAQIKEVNDHLAHLVEYTVDWFRHLQKQFGGDKTPRLTEIRSFETIQAAKVVEANQKLYVNYDAGFIGTDLKKDDDAEFVSTCSDIDDIIVFLKDGKYKVVKVADKLYVGQNIQYAAVFRKNDKRTIYNVIYSDGKNGPCYMKRFDVRSVTRDKEYDVTSGTEGSKLMYFSANGNGEAETVKVFLRQTSRRIKNKIFEVDFSHLAIKGRQSRGNLVTKNPVLKIQLKEKGVSTLGGSKIWFDPDVLRLNIDKRGDFLGEFFPEDQILIITKDGQYYTTGFELTNHFDDNILRIEKFDENKIWSMAFYDADQEYYYIKRFQLVPSVNKMPLTGENSDSRFVLISDNVYPRFKVTFGESDSFREPLEIDVDEFIGVKSVKARGKRITTYAVGKITELEPTRVPEKKDDGHEEDSDNGEDDVETDEFEQTKNTMNDAQISVADNKTDDVLEGIEIESITPEDPELMDEIDNTKNTKTSPKKTKTEDDEEQMSLF